MFTLKIQVASIEESELILASLRGNPSATPTADPGMPPSSAVRFPAKRRPRLPKELRQALATVQGKYGLGDMTKPLAILAKFGAANVRDLAPKDYPEFIAACEAA